MGRAPCCDKVGLKKGPWTPEEDEILINFIQKHGHSNWRALPKQSGLLRCGKSCRLRWINYLRPDIKRGNFTREEEDAIIQLHEMMGNRWSAIAARLPGRTDNEIKNVWHTHLKKRLSQYQTPKSQAKVARKGRNNADNNSTTTAITTTTTTDSSNYSDNHAPTSASPQQSFTTSEDFSSSTEVSSIEFPNNVSTVNNDVQTFDNSIGYTNLENEYFPIIDETFWESQEIPLEGHFYNMNSSSEEFSDIMIDENQLQFDTLMRQVNTPIMSENGVGIFGDDNIDFWLDVFVQAGGTPESPEFY